jgi:hypothetical protein
MNTRIVRDLELRLEMQELRELGLNDDDLDGFLDLYYEEWGLDDVEAFNN